MISIGFLEHTPGKYEFFVRKLRSEGIMNVQTGIFAADMKLSIVNDGPVTIILDTDIWLKNSEKIDVIED